MKFPTLLALLFAAALCSGCTKGVPANINASDEAEQAAQDSKSSVSNETAPDDRYKDYAQPKWNHENVRRDSTADGDDDSASYRRRDDEDAASVTDALKEEADEVADNLRHRAVKGIDSISDRFEQTIERGLKKVDKASREAFEDSQQY